MPTKPLLCTLSLCLLNACATANPQTPPQTPVQSSSDGIPYPVPTVQDQISYLENKVIQLNSEIETLAGKVARLEQQHEKNSTALRKHPVQKLSDRKLKEHYLHEENTATPIAHTASQAQNTYRQALKHYKNGKYAAAAALLKGADGGDGSDTAQRSMYLLLQSNAGMGKCESVIEIGRRYSNRFKDSPQAPEALYKIGECQYRLQQKDIARTTWRSLIQSYPGSAAAKRAAEAVKKR